ncbi:golgin subfamily A member 6-like protein 22 isoform X2 [Anguilla anguilla]|uniref:golgin subfamily A member 6-like protein 22 isoform X2 n=1 Tax=Anguilla anguilla TaxID=7936 RepID=UPI0015AE6AB3|nr:golgin subfamily A member 6-like protein 22 isoform X2 [Anguilla anguilla]
MAQNSFPCFVEAPGKRQPASISGKTMESGARREREQGEREREMLEKVVQVLQEQGLLMTGESLEDLRTLREELRNERQQEMSEFRQQWMTVLENMEHQRTQQHRNLEVWRHWQECQLSEQVERFQQSEMWRRECEEEQGRAQMHQMSQQWGDKYHRIHALMSEMHENWRDFEELNRREQAEVFELCEGLRREWATWTEQRMQERNLLERETREHDRRKEREEWRKQREFMEISHERVELQHKMEIERLEVEIRELRSLILRITEVKTERESTEETYEPVTLATGNTTAVLIEEEINQIEVENERNLVTVEIESSARESKKQEKEEKESQKHKKKKSFWSRFCWKKRVTTKKECSEETVGQSALKLRVVGKLTSPILAGESSREKEKKIEGVANVSKTETEQEQKQNKKTKGFWSLWRGRK